VYINRAVVLPVSLSRDITQTISMISANKQLLQGGTFDPGLRRFIVDRNDVPTSFTLKKDDWLVYDGRRYDIKTVEEFEYKTGWLIAAKQIQGAAVNQDILVHPTRLLTLNQTVIAVIT
jgi:hypothetical protein